MPSLVWMHTTNLINNGRPEKNVTMIMLQYLRAPDTILLM